MSREETIAIVDVRQGGARVAIVQKNGQSPLRVLTTGASMLPADTVAPETSTASIGTRIAEAAATAQQGLEGAVRASHVQNVYVIAHEPLVHSEVVHVRDLLHPARAVGQEEVMALAKSAYAQVREIELEHLLEARVFGIRLNGYPTQRMKAEHVASIEVASLFTAMDPQTRAAIEAAIQRAFPAAAMEWHSGLRALLTVIREAEPELRDYLVVDVGMDTTHFISIRDVDVLDHRVVPEGAATISKRLAPGRPVEETLGFLRMIGREACEGSTCDAVQNAIAATEPELLQIFGDALGAMATIRRLPNSLIVFSNDELTPWLSTFFSRIDFSQFTRTSQPLVPLTRNQDALARMVDSPADIDRETAFAAALVHIEGRA